ncbi:MAG: hypothetical protein LVR00_06025 [Rhabdochlamydiaceae bacterium]|jgi:lipid A disaccharide synthetase
MYATYRIAKFVGQQASIIYNRTELQELVQEKKNLTENALANISKKIEENQGQDEDMKQALDLVQRCLQDKLDLYNRLLPSNRALQTA